MSVIIPISLHFAGGITLQSKVAHTLKITELKEELFDGLEA